MPLVLDNKNRYFSDTSLRGQEIESQNMDVPAESAYAHLVDLLDGYIQSPLTLTPVQMQEVVRLLAELAVEGLKQGGGKSIDLRGVSAFKSDYQRRIGEERLSVYSSIVREEWAKVQEHYQRTGKTQIDFQDITVEPLLLSPLTEQPVEKWALRPADQAGTFYCYCIETEAEALETYRQVNSTPYSHISIGHLENFLWSAELYPRNPETVYSSFRGLIDAKLDEFKKRYGNLTPTVTFKVSDTLKQTVGGDSFKVGWKVSVKALQPPTVEAAPKEPPAQAQPKKSLLDKLTSLL